MKVDSTNQSRDVSGPEEQSAHAAPLAAGTVVEQALALQRAVGNRATGQLLGGRPHGGRPLSRVLQFQQPLKGQISKQGNAFDRRQEFVDRINRQGTGVLFTLADDGRTLTYRSSFFGQPSPFEAKMVEFIDNTQTVPMRLVQKASTSVVIDQFALGIVDIDDLLASDDMSFQINLIHFLTERFAVSDYAKKLDTGLGPSFHKAHEAGIQAEVDHLRTLTGDSTIEFAGETVDASNGWAMFLFTSKSGGYQVKHILKTRKGGVTGGEVLVREKGAKQDITLEEFIDKRAAAATPAAPAAAIPAPAPAPAG